MIETGSESEGMSPRLQRYLLRGLKISISIVLWYFNLREIIKFFLMGYPGWGSAAIVALVMPSFFIIFDFYKSGIQALCKNKCLRKIYHGFVIPGTFQLANIIW
jgi:hypothetical protein